MRRAVSAETVAERGKGMKSKTKRMGKLQWKALVLSVLLAGFVAAAVPTMDAAGKQSIPQSLEDLNSEDRLIGISTGSVTEEYLQREAPNAVICYYDDKFMGFTDVANGKIDAFVYDYRQMELAIQNGQKGVRLLDECLAETMKIAVGISEVSDIPDLKEKINRFIADIKADGTLDDMFQRWVNDGNDAMPDIPVPEAPGYRLKVGTCGIAPPYSYYEGSKLTGYDIEMARRFAAWLNADLEFQVYDYTAIIPALKAGKVDCVMANLQYSREREENFVYSDTLYEEKQGIMVHDEGSGEVVAVAEKADTDAGEPGFWAGIKSSFEKTFILENRWQMFLQGIGNTLIITVASILCGTLLGFAVYMLCRKGNPVYNGLTRFSMSLVQGMPMVVLLMILYYVIFGKAAIGGIAVAIIGFTLTFGAAVTGLLRMGVGAVETGQYEAAYALGYSNRRTFFRIILPQALPHVMSAYRGEIISLIKSTSIVGYIAVQDLTKMGDIVRSRTYEAFFPLIAVTIIYFLLEGAIAFLVSRISLNINPKHRKAKNILKGVKTDD